MLVWLCDYDQPYSFGGSAKGWEAFGLGHVAIENRLHTHEMIESRMSYIYENPVRAGWVENTEEYLYSSARNYSVLKGLTEVEYW